MTASFNIDSFQTLSNINYVVLYFVQLLILVTIINGEDFNLLVRADNMACQCYNKFFITYISTINQPSIIKILDLTFKYFNKNINWRVLQTRCMKIKETQNKHFAKFRTKGLSERIYYFVCKTFTFIAPLFAS